MTVPTQPSPPASGRATPPPTPTPARDPAEPLPLVPPPIAPPSDQPVGKPAQAGQRDYTNAADVSGQPWSEVVYWFALALAAAADIAAFHQVVSLVMRDQGDALVWLMVVGLTVIALTLAHFAGRVARDVTAGHGTATRKQVYALAVPWAVLGLAAFAVRLLVADSTGGTTLDGTVIGSDSVDQSTRQISGAVLFLALYVGSGAVAAVGEYLSRNPMRAGYRRALRAHSRALDRLARSQPPYELALQTYRQRARIRAREEANWQAARELRLAQADELKRYAAVLIAAHLQDPSVTDAMTLPDRRPITATTEPQGKHAAIDAGRRAQTRPAVGFLRRPTRRSAIEGRRRGAANSPQGLEPARDTDGARDDGQRAG